MSSEAGSGEFMMGFFVGALVGAATALLFAPISGEEMRSQIKDRGIELKDRAGDLGVEASRRADDLRVRGQSLLEQQRARLQEAIEEGKQAAARTKEDLLSQFEAAKSTDKSLDLTES